MHKILAQCLGVLTVFAIASCSDSFSDDGGTGPVASGGGGGTAGGSQGGGGGPAGAAGGGQGGTSSGPCVPGQFGCLDDLLRKCSDKGAWVNVQACGSGLCSDKTGGCLTCKPNAPSGCADDHTQKVCDASGMTEHTAACPAGGSFCMDGVCGQCKSDSDCPSPSQDCLEAACVKAKCGTRPAASGKAAKAQTPHDCKQQVCDGAGGVMAKADPSDALPDDGNPCTDESCAGTQPQTTSTKAGTKCSLSGADGVCTGTGLCADCVPNTTRCTGNQLETCSAQGKWVAGDCSLPTPVCSEGACVGVKQLSAGTAHTCALLDDGRLRCWGANHKGAIGNGQSGVDLVVTAPVAVPSLVGVKQVAAGGEHTCAIMADATVSCWGDNTAGQLGMGAGAPLAAPSPAPVSGLMGVGTIRAGAAHTCAVKQDGNLHCWGKNDDGELGVGMVGSKNSPQWVDAINDVRLLSLGQSHTCVAIGDEMKVSCWGADSNGQLGNGPSVQEDKYTPIMVPMVPKVSLLMAGSLNTCAELSVAQSFVCWGADDEQQLGDGNSGDKPSPVTTSFPSGVTAAAGGYQHTCVIAAGIVICVGGNGGGQLGNGQIQTVPYSSPQTPSAVARSAGDFVSGAVEVVAGLGHTCARTATGEILCWGDNTYGQLGIGTTDKLKTYATPVTW